MVLLVVQALQKLINMILMPAKERKALGRKAKQFALDKYDIKKNAKKMTDIYYHVLNNTPFAR